MMYISAAGGAADKVKRHCKRLLHSQGIMGPAELGHACAALLRVLGLCR